MRGPLDGVRVLELGIWVAVPSAAAVLADWGARVVKIEPPEGDPLRGLAATGLVPYQPDVNPAFQLDNRGKRGVVLDLRRPGGREVAHALVRQSDVFVSNLRRQKLAALGMGYEALREVNPRLVYAGLTGYGTEGPERDRAAFDYAAFWARAGIMASLGEPEGPPPTQRPGMGDHMTGLGMAGAIAAALLARERTGVGQEIGMSLFQAGMWMLASDIQAAITTGYCHTPGGRRAAPNPLFNFYRTKDDRWIHLIAFARTSLPDGRPLRLVKSPVAFGATPAEVSGPAPELGQHTEEVLLEAGYTWEDIARLKESGTLG